MSEVHWHRVESHSSPKGHELRARARGKQWRAWQAADGTWRVKPTGGPQKPVTRRTWPDVRSYVEQGVTHNPPPQEIQVELVDEDEGDVEWSGTLEEFLEANDEDTLPMESGEIADHLWRHGSLTLGGGAAPMMTLRTANPRGRKRNPSAAKQAAQAVARKMIAGDYYDPRDPDLETYKVTTALRQQAHKHGASYEDTATAYSHLPEVQGFHAARDAVRKWESGDIGREEIRARALKIARDRKIDPQDVLDALDQMKIPQTRPNPGGKHISCGDLSKKDCRQLQHVYESARARGYSKVRAAKQAWGAVNRNPKRKTNAVAKGARGEADTTAGDELELYIDNEQPLYRKWQAIVTNIQRHKARGNYSHERAVDGFMYLVDDGAKKYAKEFASPREWNTIFDAPTRRYVANEYAKSFEKNDRGENEYAPMKKNPTSIAKNPTSVAKRRRNPVRGRKKNGAGLGAFIGSLVGSAAGFGVASYPLAAIGSVLGGAIGGHIGAPRDRKRRGAAGGALGGALLGPIGAAAGGYIGGQRADKDLRRNPEAAAKRVENPRSENPRRKNARKAGGREYVVWQHHNNKRWFVSDGVSAAATSAKGYKSASEAEKSAEDLIYQRGVKATLITEKPAPRENPAKVTQTNRPALKAAPAKKNPCDCKGPKRGRKNPCDCHGKKKAR